MPKQAVDVDKHEVRRGIRINAAKQLEILGFRLPTKSGLFQPDLYPPFPSTSPSSNVEEWLTGVDKEPITMELRPVDTKGKNKKKAGGLAAKLAGKASVDLEEKKEESPAVLQAEIAQLKKKFSASSDMK